MKPAVPMKIAGSIDSGSGSSVFSSPLGAVYVPGQEQGYSLAVASTRRGWCGKRGRLCAGGWGHERDSGGSIAEGIQILSWARETPTGDHHEYAAPAEE